MLRLTRMARLMRFVRAVPELMVLLKGIRAASRSVMWTFGLLLIIVYVFAVAFRILGKSNGLSTRGFGTVHESMATFLLDGLLPDSAEPVRSVGNEHIAYAVLFFLFIVIGSITVMNMLTGMLVQVVSSIADVEKEEMNLGWVKRELERVMRAMDSNKDELLSKQEIEHFLVDAQVCRVMTEVGVDVLQLVEVAEFHIFRDRDAISFREFLDLVLQLRAAKTVCMRDIVHLQQFVSNEVFCMEDRLLDSIQTLLSESMPDLPIRASQESRGTLHTVSEA